MIFVVLWFSVVIKSLTLRPVVVLAPEIETHPNTLGMSHIPLNLADSSLCKLVTEVDEVLSARGQVLPQYRYCGVKVGLDSAHIGAVVTHSVQGVPRKLHMKLQRVER